MSTEVNGDNILLGRGKVYFDRFTSAGAATGERFLGNCPSFEITPTAEDIKKYSSATPAAPLIASDVLRTTLALRIAGDEFTAENLAMALFGDSANLTQSTAAITDEVITVVAQGRYYPTLYRGISSVTVTGPSETPTYDVNDDYTVDATEGRIYIVPGGAITASTVIWVDYTYADLDVERVRGMNQTSVKGYVRFVGDPGRGPQYTCEIWRASIHADGAMGFISDEYAQWTMIGDIESDATNHPNEPHFRLIKVA
jgi:hypothetical protein